MGKWAQGVYTPKHPEKYIGKNLPKYRSSWELACFTFLDSHPGVVHWSSECFKIPYMHPFKGRQSIYIPDLFVVSVGKNGKQTAEIIEIKPRKQSIVEGRMSTKNKMEVAINHAKWQAASAFCKRLGIGFRIMTEDSMFRNGKK